MKEEKTTANSGRIPSGDRLLDDNGSYPHVKPTDRTRTTACRILVKIAGKPAQTMLDY